MSAKRSRAHSDWDTFRWYTVMPAVALVLFVGVMVAFFAYLQRSETEQQRQTMYRDIEWAQQNLRLRLRANQDAVAATAAEWSDAARGDGDLLRPAARTFLLGNPDASYVGLIDNDRRISWLLPNVGSTVPSDRQPGSTLPDSPGSSAYDEARIDRQPVYTQPFTQPGGDTLVEMHVPVLVDRGFMGTIVVGYSLRRMVTAGLPIEVLDRYRVSLIDQAGTLLAASSRKPVPPDGLTYELALEPPGHGMRLRAQMVASRPMLIDRTLQAAVIGLSAAIVVSLVMLWRYARSRAEAEAERDRLFELSIDVLCVLRADGRFMRVNPAFSEMFERDGIVDDLLSIIHPDDRPTVMAALDRLARAGDGGPVQAESFEARCAPAGDGWWRWLEWSIRSASGRGAGRGASATLYAVAHDVTDRKAAESALAAETAFRRAMEDSLLTGMRAYDMQGRITYVNRAFCRMLGYEEHELVGATAPFAYWDPDHHAEQFANVDAVLRGEAPESGFSVPCIRKDGTRLIARMYVSPLVDAQGRQTGWMTSMTDITEPTRVRRELEAAHERFATVLDELAVAVSVAAPVAQAADEATAGQDEGRPLELLFANRMYKAVFGTTADGHRALAPAVHAPDASVLGESRAPAEGVEVWDASVQRWFEARTRGVRWVDGRPVQLLVAADVTARRSAQEQQRQQDERLQRTSRLMTMGEMASSLAHELNQPLTAIANYTMGIAARVRHRKARGEAVDPDELIEMLTKTARQAERAGQVLRRIRDFVKRSEPARTACKVETIVAEALGLAEIDARRHRVRIDVRLPQDAPVLWADPILIEQVLLNLVKNGIEAMRDSSRRQLEVKVQLLAGAVEFLVSDVGPGLAEGAREKLFQPFFTTKTEGMGMGLNICRSIIESHQGRLWVEEREGGGCTFGFTLPLIEADARRADARVAA